MIGNVSQVLVESDNFARTPDDIPIKITGTQIAPRTICDVNVTGIDGMYLVGRVIGRE